MKKAGHQLRRLGKSKLELLELTKEQSRKKMLTNGELLPQLTKSTQLFFPLNWLRASFGFTLCKGDLIFDPFGGSGTVGKAALVFGRHFFLCKKVAEYVEHTMQRLDAALFAAIKPRVLSLTDLKSKMMVCTNK